MQAVILAAGIGTRLRPRTDTLPKCLIEIWGEPILQRQLTSLEQTGVRRCIIVVGYRGDQVQAYFGVRFRSMEITYIYNDRFDNTNNLFSLWLAREYLTEDTVLLEGDLVFDHGILADLVDNPHPDVAVVDQFHAEMNGTVILAEWNFATSMVLKAEQSSLFDYGPALKTVNIYRFSQAALQQKVLPALERSVAEGKNDDFYESAIAGLIAKGELHMAVQRTGARRWAEIDTEEDLREAVALFQTPTHFRDA